MQARSYLASRLGQRVFAFVAVCAALPALGATWKVEKDGSGDFTVIQDAVDAASSGDTIAIGPGRFDDFSDEHWEKWTLAAVEDKGLNFVGAGADQTFLGPENFGDIEGDYVSCIDVRAEGLTTRIRDITFENVQKEGLIINRSGRLELDDCVFRNNGGGVFALLGEGGWIRNCQFTNINTEFSATAVILYEPSIGVLVEDCYFEQCRVGIGSYWPGCTDITVNQCEIVDGYVGVSFVSGASGRMLDCTLEGLTQWGFTASGPGSVILEGNTIDLTGTLGRCLRLFASSHYLRNNVISGSNVLVGQICMTCELDIRDNVFLRTGPDAWYIHPGDGWYDGPLVHRDFSYNSWGTDDPDAVAAWIYDQNDDPDHHVIIDYLPMNGTVATEPRSWSSVKGLFE